MTTKNNLIINYLPLANKLAHSYHADHHTLEELKSVAYLSLVEAAHKYDENKSSFMTYAHWKISFSLKDYFRNMKKLTKIKFFDLENDN